MSKRKAGWYWVRDGLGWEPLRWSGCVWDGHLNDADLEQVGQRIPEPDEPWQCVPVEPTSVMEDILSAWADNPSQSWIEVLAASPNPGDA